MLIIIVKIGRVEYNFSFNFFFILIFYLNKFRIICFFDSSNCTLRIGLEIFVLTRVAFQAEGEGCWYIRSKEQSYSQRPHLKQLSLSNESFPGR